MPIYEFKCSKCEEVFELLQLGSSDKEAKCPNCGSSEFEKIMSTTNFAVNGGSPQQSSSVENRTCSTGSCTTWNLPGPK